MADEILFSGLSGSARLAAVLAKEIELTLADRASLHKHPSIKFMGNVTGSGSNVIQTPIVGLDGYDLMSSPSDGAAVSNTALTETNANISFLTRLWCWVRSRSLFQLARDTTRSAASLAFCIRSDGFILPNIFFAMRIALSAS